MAVAFDSKTTTVASGTQPTGATTWSGTGITVGASATLLLIWQEVDVAAGGTVTMIWDAAGANQAMTQIGSAVVNSAGATAMSTVLFGLVNPAAGAKIITTNWSAGAGHNSYLAAISFTGTSTASVAAATYALNTASANQASGTSISIASAAAINSGDMAVGFWSDLNGPSAINGTSIGINTGLTTNGSAAYYSGAGATVTSTVTVATPDQYTAQIVGVTVPTVAAAAGPTFFPMGAQVSG